MYILSPLGETVYIIPGVKIINPSKQSPTMEKRIPGKMQPPTGVGNRKRQSLTLDLNSASSKRNRVQSLLTSPDVQMLKLTSPELEKFLSQNPGLATPTPNGYTFPRSVTEEQMMYAKGFEEALEQMKQADSTTVLSDASVAAANTLARLNVAVTHSLPPTVLKQETLPLSLPTAPLTLTSTPSVPLSLPSAPLSLPSATLSLPNAPLSQPSAPSIPLSLPSAPLSLPSAPLSLPTAPRPLSRPNSGASGSIDSSDSYNVQVKDEPDDQSLSGGEYSNLMSPNSNSGVSPIDMDAQEKIKLERKRMRNRLAASKCRKRKLERISQLDDRVKQLKTENSDLAAVVKKMKSNVALLKQEVIEHVNSGCEIRMTDSSTFS